MRDPQVFLMDEPLSNLDAKLRTQTRGEIRRLQQEVRTTTVYVTHDQVEAMTMGDRIAVMNDGVLEQVGTPEELYERPANRFVAGFIGSPAMSFVEDPRNAAADAEAAAPGAVVGVRPEHARPWRDGLIGPLRGTVAFVEALGRETFVGVDVGDARLVVFEEGRATRDVGDELEFGLVPSGLRYVDDPATPLPMLKLPAPGAVVGVRPEHARAWRDGLIGPLRGVVAFVEALGRETFVGVDVGDARLVVFEEGRATRDVGDELEFGLVPAGLRYFSPDTGEAL